MTEGNFVDYVKIHASSGKGGKGSTHLHREKYITKGGPDGGMAVEVVMLFSKEIQTCGLFWILNSIVILKPNTEKTEARIEVQALMGKIAWLVYR